MESQSKIRPSRSHYISGAWHPAWAMLCEEHQESLSWSRFVLSGEMGGQRPFPNTTGFYMCTRENHSIGKSRRLNLTMTLFLTSLVTLDKSFNMYLGLHFHHPKKEIGLLQEETTQVPFNSKIMCNLFSLYFCRRACDTLRCWHPPFCCKTRHVDPRCLEGSQRQRMLRGRCSLGAGAHGRVLRGEPHYLAGLGAGFLSLGPNTW